MVAYSFQSHFAEPILAGTKGGTIRAARHQKARRGCGGSSLRPGGHARPGEELQLYTGMRTKHCRLIALKRCIEIEPIQIRFKPDFAILLDSVGVICMPDHLAAFARFDGFKCPDEMRLFWTVDRFDGWHIRWLPLPAIGRPAT